jgi:hypothetical protein
MTEHTIAPATGVETDAAPEVGLGAGASVATALPARKRNNMANRGMAASMALLSATAIFVLSFGKLKVDFSLVLDCLCLWERCFVKDYIYRGRKNWMKRDIRFKNRQKVGRSQLCMSLFVLHCLPGVY